MALLVQIFSLYFSVKSHVNIPEQSLTLDISVQLNKVDYYYLCSNELFSNVF